MKNQPQAIADILKDKVFTGPKKYTGQPQAMQDIFKEMNIPAPWIETRGRKPKYLFHQMQPGEIITRPVSLQKARIIQTGMKAAANRQGIKITIQNKGTFLKIKRLK